MHLRCSWPEGRNVQVVCLIHLAASPAKILIYMKHFMGLLFVLSHLLQPLYPPGAVPLCQCHDNKALGEQNPGPRLLLLEVKDKGSRDAIGQE